jgi:dihydrolipoamide dehydrogenase
LIGSLEALEKARKAEAFGFSTGPVVPDWTHMKIRKDRIVSQLVAGIERLLAGNKVRVVRGRGLLTSPSNVRVVDASGAEAVLEASRAVLVATGSEPARPAAFPFDGNHVLTSDELLESTDLPKSLLVVGAGAIGAEFARVFHSLGIAVHLVEMLNQVLPGMDARVSQAVAVAMKKRGIEVRTSSAVSQMTLENGTVLTKLASGETLRTEKALVATGRSPRADGLGLEALGVTRQKGFIRTDAFGRTDAPGVYAAGDVAGKWLLAYTAAREGMRSVEHALGREVPPDDGVVPVTVFTDPEAACVGLAEKEASERGIEVRVGRIPFAGNGKAMAVDETEGFVALVAEASTDRLLGGQVVGAHASDLIAEIALAIRLKATAGDVASTLHSHPTFAESVMEAAHDAHGEAIHKLRR